MVQSSPVTLLKTVILNCFLVHNLSKMPHTDQCRSKRDPRPARFRTGNCTGSNSSQNLVHMCPRPVSVKVSVSFSINTFIVRIIINTKEFWTKASFLVLEQSLLIQPNTVLAHVHKTQTSCFRLNVFRHKKLNKWNFSNIGQPSDFKVTNDHKSWSKSRKRCRGQTTVL